ncbi:MAG: hypothetical protein J0I79_14910 [Mesorhizobium sp.]|uniref:hypothetical protein n=1 Tax=Mesorhizobium sp. TaxID=1871066 RepID=UPI001ACE5D8C|nr:hypothetical protein [Mesorhizobium sp.]MBN9219240.1 hypothetical protein [Mesorhizobium sp.]
MVSAWLRGNMLASSADPSKAAKAIVDSLMDYKGTTEHGHHFLIDKCRDIGLTVSAIEDDQPLQEDILSVHYSFVATFAKTATIKLIQNGENATWTVDA